MLPELDSSSTDPVGREVTVSYSPDRRGFPYREKVRGSIIASVLLAFVAATVGIVALISQIWFPNLGAVGGAVLFFIIFVVMSILGIMVCLRIDQRKAMHVLWFGHQNRDALRTGLNTAGYSMVGNWDEWDINSLVFKEVVENSSGTKFIIWNVKPSVEGLVLTLQ